MSRSKTVSSPREPVQMNHTAQRHAPIANFPPASGSDAAIRIVTLDDPIDGSPSLAHLPHQLVDRGDDPVFDVAGPPQGGAAVLEQAGTPFVAPFLPHAARRDVG